MFEPPEVNPSAVSSVTKPVVVVLVPVPVRVVKVYDPLVVVRVPFVLLLVPVEKKVSSASEPRVLLPLPVLGGGLIQTSVPRRAPLDIVTGPPSPSTVLPSPNPKLPRPRALVMAEENSSSRSVSEVVRLRELLRLGAITLGSPG